MATAQKPIKPSASELYQSVRKLNVLGSVLYVAAHPDDENQRFISYCANEKLYQINYLSLTRGDGGQNLIGPELRELLGVLRSEELLMARSVDGGKQRFSRANDFGFSKSPEETLRIWDKDKVLSDVVWTIRETQPDVIVNRFYHDKKYDTHGHHTASAMLSVEAFDLAGKADVYPEQLSLTSIWQPRRQFFNTSWFFFGGREAFDKMDKSGLFTLDLGVYLPLKGKSNNEVAAEARSMHRCQGFGAMSSRGESRDWFDFIKGERPPSQDIFDGINTTWTRVEGGATIGQILAKVEKEFSIGNPSGSIPDLLSAMQLMKALPEGYWKTIKMAEIKEVIRGCLGLYLEATAAEPSATPGESVKLRLEAIQRSAPGICVVELGSITVRPSIFDTITSYTMLPTKAFILEKSINLPKEATITAPFWLMEPSTLGMYKVDNQTRVDMPETPRYAKVRWGFIINGIPIEYYTDVAYKIEEPAIGEIWKPFEVLPPAFVEFTQSAYVFNAPKQALSVRVKAGRDNLTGVVKVIASNPAWFTTGGTQPFSITKKGQEQVFNFSVETKAYGETTLNAYVEVDGKTYNYRLIPIKYDHIPQQSVLMPNQVNIVKSDLKVSAKNIGYFMGAGDEVPAALRQMGCTVTLLEDKDMELAKLKTFDAIVLGIRAYNTKENLKFYHKKLMAYVQEGGTLVTQYNNNFDLFVEKLAPYDMKLSRTRVTDENSEVRLLLPDHPVLNKPNKITAKDFEGWVQERGLYFPSEWAADFEAPISCNDPGEKAANGAVLTAKYGKGHFVYTGISFFREMPFGVSGAYRLLANMVSLGK